MDVDLSELDDWLGTLEELQLGLELCHSVTGTRQNDPNVSPTTPGTGIMSGSASCVNRTFSQQPASPRFPVSSSRAPTAHVNPVAQESASSYENTTFPVPGPYPAHNGQSRLNGAGANGTHAGLASKSVPVGTIGRTHKEATAESDLSSLLQELEVVEERMKELESENTTFTRFRKKVVANKRLPSGKTTGAGGNRTRAVIFQTP